MKNNKSACILLFAIITLLFTGTIDARTKRKKGIDCENQVHKAISYYNKKYHNKVKTILNEVKIQCSGSTIMDTAIYYLGRSYLDTKEASQARMELEALIQDYPQSPFFEEAHFLLGVCSVKESQIYERDQAETKDAIREFNEFIDQFPQTRFADSVHYYLNLCYDKLAKKEFMSAKFYEKVDQYDAAIVYYKIIIQEFPESKYVPECHIGLAVNLIKINRKSEAKKILDDLLASDVDSFTKNRAKLISQRMSQK